MLLHLAQDELHPKKHGGSECVKTPTHYVNEVNKMNVDNE